jgi:hypothetical protein
MAGQLKSQIPQNPTQKEPFFVGIKVRGEVAKYKAWVGDYVAHGITAGNKEAVKEVVARMAAAQYDLIDKLKQLAATVVDNVVAASRSNAYDIGTHMGTYFHLGEYMAVMVKIQRVTHPRAASKWWGEIRVMFKGSDGHKALSKHVVGRYVEFYSDIVPRDKLYNVVSEAMRIAFNAYMWAHKNQ